MLAISMLSLRRCAADERVLSDVRRAATQRRGAQRTGAACGGCAGGSRMTEYAERFWQGLAKLLEGERVVILRGR